MVGTSSLLIAAWLAAQRIAIKKCANFFAAGVSGTSNNHDVAAAASFGGQPQQNEKGDITAAKEPIDLLTYPLAATRCYSSHHVVSLALLVSRITLFAR